MTLIDNMYLYTNILIVWSLMVNMCALFEDFGKYAVIFFIIDVKNYYNFSTLLKYVLLSE